MKFGLKSFFNPSIGLTYALISIEEGQGWFIAEYHAISNRNNKVLYLNFSRCIEINSFTDIEDAKKIAIKDIETRICENMKSFPAVNFLMEDDLDKIALLIKDKYPNNFEEIRLRVKNIELKEYLQLL